MNSGSDVYAANSHFYSVLDSSFDGKRLVSRFCVVPISERGCYGAADAGCRAIAYPSYTPTLYSITPPQDFYVGDAVFVGQSGAPLRLRFRLQHVQSQPAGSRNLVTWRLEIRNLGSATYEIISVALMVITRITTASGEETGT